MRFMYAYAPHTIREIYFKTSISPLATSYSRRHSGRRRGRHAADVNTTRSKQQSYKYQLQGARFRVSYRAYLLRVSTSPLLLWGASGADKSGPAATEAFHELSHEKYLSRRHHSPLIFRAFTGEERHNTITHAGRVRRIKRPPESMRISKRLDDI